MTVTQMDHNGSGNRKKNWGPERKVILNREPRSGLGLSIVGGSVDVYNGISGKYENIAGIFIKNITPDSPAYRTGKLKAGDRIIEVDGVNLRNSTHEHAVDLIQTAGDSIHLLVQSLGAEEEHKTVNHRESSNTESRMFSDNRSISTCEPQGSLLHRNLIRDQPDTPEVIQEGNIGRAMRDSRRGINTRPKDNVEDANDVQRDRAEKIRSSIKKSIRKKAPLPPAEQNSLREVPEDVENKQPTTEPTKSNKYSSEESSDDEDTRHMEGNVYTKAGMEISRKSAGNVKRSKQEIEADPEEEDDFGYTTRKIEKKYRNFGNAIKTVVLEKDRLGLGIALSGHKDRNKMAVFICGINPNGIAFKTGGLSAGDEILEVNGHVLQNRCHLNASSIIKGIPGTTFKIIVVRRSSGIKDLAVPPLRQFPSSLEDDGTAQFSQYRGVHVVSVKKGQYGLGIMIIEGKHAEVGQGIFVSDIQEGSAAEQAGLQVGDLILAVNFDCLLGSTYDAATSLLKKTEGVVKLTVCNPNQSKVAQEEEEKAKKANDPSPEPEKEAKPEAAKEPEKPKEPEPPADPKDCKILVGKDTTIEIQHEKDKPIGFTIIGGSNTPLVGVFILDVYAEGSVGKDGRLKPGDQIIEFCRESFKAIEHDKAHASVLKAAGPIHMIVLREEKRLEEIDVELQQKPGRGIGLCMTGYNSGKGAYVSELVPGCSAIESGKIIEGDVIVSVCGEEVREMPVEDIALLMKVSNPVNLKLNRYKSTRT